MADAEIFSFVFVQAPLLVCGISIILGAIGLAVAYLINRPIDSEKRSKLADSKFLRLFRKKKKKKLTNSRYESMNQ